MSQRAAKIMDMVMVHAGWLEMLFGGVIKETGTWCH